MFSLVITLLKFKAAKFAMEGAIEKAHSIAKSHSLALSIAPPLETLQITADLNFKSFVTLLF